MELRCVVFSALLASGCAADPHAGLPPHLAHGYPALDDLTELMQGLPYSYDPNAESGSSASLYPAQEDRSRIVSAWCAVGPDLATRAEAVDRTATSNYSAEAYELLRTAKNLRDECARGDTELVFRIGFMLDRLARIRKHSGHSDPR